jgi:hypothetical protein
VTAVTLGELFGSFQHSAFRLEALDRYLVEGEQEASFQQFLRDDTLPEPGPEEQAWLRQVTDWKAAGKTLERVHAIGAELTPYLRWELEMYQRTSAAGEDIRICGATRRPWLQQAISADFWLFDDATAVECRYDPSGRWLGVEAATHPIDYYRRLRTLLLSPEVSVPLTAYLARHRDPAGARS